MAISLFIAGDVVPEGIQQKDLSSRSEQVFREVQPFISKADFAIVNLEAPVIKGNSTPIKKSGPCLSTPPSTVRLLKDAGFDVFTLANNHFFDQGQNGVDTTVDICNECCIRVVGGGKTIQMARKPLFLEKEGKCIAIINACEHEFSIADIDHGGSNPLDLINIREDIVRVRKEADFVVLILHGGIEMYQYPTPRMKRLYHHFVDLGADAVINHHQHCVCGYEVYHNKPIFYGLGNFYFPLQTHLSKDDNWNKGYIVLLELGDTIGFEMIPYIQDFDTVLLSDKNVFEKEIELLNLPIADDFLLQQKFDEHVLSKEKLLISGILPSFMQGRCVSFLIRRGVFGNLFKRTQRYSIKNRLTCESHYETLQRLFDISSK